MMEKDTAIFNEADVLHIQAKIFNLTVENIEETVDDLSHLDFQDEHHTHQIFSCLHNATETRSLKIKVFATFSLRFLRKRQPEGPLDDLFLKFGMVSFKFFKPHHASYVLQCANIGIISYERIIAKLKRFATKRPECNYMIFTAFCWFAPEIERIDPDLYSSIYSHFEKKCSMPNSAIVFKLFFKQIEVYKENNWQVHRRATETLQVCTDDDPQTKFINDDIEVLQRYTEVHGVDTKIAPSIFFKSPFMSKFPTIIQVTAYYGMKKLFFFLVERGSKLNSPSFSNQTLMQFAVAGGSMEIIEFLLKTDCDRRGLLHFAAMAYQNELFKWLHTNGQADINEVYGNFGLPIHQAAKANNVEILRYCADQNGADINARNSEKRTPLHICCTYGCLDSLMLLLSFPQIEVNAKDVIVFYL